MATINERCSKCGEQFKKDDTVAVDILYGNANELFSTPLRYHHNPNCPPDNIEIPFLDAYKEHFVGLRNKVIKLSNTVESLTKQLDEYKRRLAAISKLC